MSDLDFYALDKNGDAWKAFKYREKASIREFAEILGDFDKNKYSEGYYPDQEAYRQKVDPWIKVLTDGVRVEEVPSDDEIPF